MFKVGDKIVHKHSGVCIVQKVDEKMITSGLKTFYILKNVHSYQELLVPIDSGLIRPLNSKDNINKVLHFLKYDTINVTASRWRNRYTEFAKVLSEGDLMQMAVLYKILFSANVKKTLSYGEQKVFDKLYTFLNCEIFWGMNSTDANKLSIEAVGFTNPIELNTIPVTDSDLVS